ncbi:hypothetical protein TVAGG3_0643150 [Trichomonas vaginalis G3]|uniref:hypothetical protein n=1 Tax=Trichomonas vaginalis (strain ATCC PRA-98 / G3) TaxID=412133 RepID=UPI0021E532E0|nr:hypothetical protein TVAGG3_0643150 [Trichomonas vaginalis G3]KAI5505318.1 hypothetical protein TVAGG3_0643150 [Trichomonas vaginalis G3]
MRDIVSFLETCRGNVSQNETLRPTGVHNTLLSVKLALSYDAEHCSFWRHAEAMSPRMRHCDRQECTKHSCRSKFCITVLMEKIVSFLETCRGNVSQNETLRPTGVHNTLLSVKLPR